MTPDRPKNWGGDRTNALSEACEEDAKRAIEAAWNCELSHFGKYSSIDFYASRGERLVALLEIKSRVYVADKFPDVWLNVRKWLALTMAEIGMGVPAYFVVRFSDGIRYIPVAQVDAHAHFIGGQTKNAKFASDIEPLIRVPLASMRKLSTGTKGDGPGKEGT